MDKIVIILSDKIVSSETESSVKQIFLQSAFPADDLADIPGFTRLEGNVVHLGNEDRYLSIIDIK